VWPFCIFRAFRSQIRGFELNDAHDAHDTILDREPSRDSARQ
jgi:hypothetical protein